MYKIFKCRFTKFTSKISYFTNVHTPLCNNDRNEIYYNERYVIYFNERNEIS